MGNARSEGLFDLKERMEAALMDTYEPASTTVSSLSIADIVKLSQAEYDALTPGVSTLYLIVG